MLHKALSLCAIFKPLMFQPAYFSITKSNIWKKSYYSEWETTIIKIALKSGWIWSEWLHVHKISQDVKIIRTNPFFWMVYV